MTLHSTRSIYSITKDAEIVLKREMREQVINFCLTTDANKLRKQITHLYLGRRVPSTSETTGPGVEGSRNVHVRNSHYI